MPTSRHIPANEIVSATIIADGSILPEEYNLISVQTQAELNRIASAKLVFRDGSLPEENFALSEQDVLVPGAEIEVKIGYDQDETSVFKGIVIKQKIGQSNGNSFLEIVCKDKAFLLTQTEKNKVFEEQKASDIIEEIAGNAGLDHEIEATEYVGEQTVQYNATDWDFLVNRAEANSLVVLTDKGKLVAKKPEVKSLEDLALQFGATLIDFETEMDATFQHEVLVARGWNYANGEAEEVSAQNLQNAAGNLTTEDIAQATSAMADQLHLSSAHNTAALQAAANAEQQRRQLSKIRGVATCQGLHTNAGDTVKLAGLGSRFNGNFLISGVTHAVRNGNWITQLKLGLSAESHLEKFKPMPKAAYAIPRTQGLEIGVVVDLEDPAGEFRVQIKIPTLNDAGNFWARVAQPDAGNGRSVFFRPEVGDEVIVGFLSNDPQYPVILGALQSSNFPSFLEQNSDNHEKGICTREELKVVFNDDEKSITISTPGGNKLLLSDQDGAIKLTDQNGNKIVMDDQGISLESNKNVTMKASQSTTIKASTDMSFKGVNVELNADAQLNATAGAAAELSSSGSTTIKGAIVQIN